MKLQTFYYGLDLNVPLSLISANVLAFGERRSGAKVVLLFFLMLIFCR